MKIEEYFTDCFVGRIKIYSHKQEEPLKEKSKSKKRKKDFSDARKKKRDWE